MFSTISPSAAAKTPAGSATTPRSSASAGPAPAPTSAPPPHIPPPIWAGLRAIGCGCGGTQKAEPCPSLLKMVQNGLAKAQSGDPIPLEQVLAHLQSKLGNAAPSAAIDGMLTYIQQHLSRSVATEPIRLMDITPSSSSSASSEATSTNSDTAPVPTSVSDIREALQFPRPISVLDELPNSSPRPVTNSSRPQPAESPSLPSVLRQAETLRPPHPITTSVNSQRSLPSPPRLTTIGETPILRQDFNSAPTAPAPIRFKASEPNTTLGRSTTSFAAGSPPPLPTFRPLSPQIGLELAPLNRSLPPLPEGPFTPLSESRTTNSIFSLTWRPTAVTPTALPSQAIQLSAEDVLPISVKATNQSLGEPSPSVIFAKQIVAEPAVLVHILQSALQSKSPELILTLLALVAEHVSASPTVPAALKLVLQIAQCMANRQAPTPELVASLKTLIAKYPSLEPLLQSIIRLMGDPAHANSVTLLQHLETLAVQLLSLGIDISDEADKPRRKKDRTASPNFTQALIQMFETLDLKNWKTAAQYREYLQSSK